MSGDKKNCPLRMSSFVIESHYQGSIQRVQPKDSTCMEEKCKLWLGAMCSVNAVAHALEEIAEVLGELKEGKF